MKRNILFTAAFATLLPGAAYAANDQVTKAEMKTQHAPSPLSDIDDNVIRAKLLAQGYEIIKYEREHDEIEVYANKDRHLWELKIDPQTGNILHEEQDN